MRIYKRGRIWHIEFQHKGIVTRESARTTNRAEALEYLKKRRAQVILKLSPPKRERLMFEDLFQFVIDDYEMNQRRSMLGVITAKNDFGRSFGGWLAAEITTDAIETWKSRRLKDGLARASINRRLLILSRAFTLAARRELITRKPVIALLDVGDNVRKGFVAPADFYAAHKHLPGWTKGLTEFMFLTGWRLGAARHLERRDYDPDTGLLRMRAALAKNKQAMAIRLPEGTRYREVMDEALADAQPHCPYLFHCDGQMVDGAKALKEWKKACAAVGLGVLLLHDLRRSAVKNMRKAGIPEPVAMRAAGFKTVTVFRRYGIVDETEVTEGLVALDQFIRKAPKTRAVVPMRKRS